MPATSAARDTPPQSLSRFRLRNDPFGGLLDGTTFALAMMLAWLVAYVTMAFLEALTVADVGTALRSAGAFAVHVLVDTLPMVPIFVLIANRTHAIELRRYVLLIAAMLVMWVYWASLDWLARDTSGIALLRPNNLPCAFEAVLVFAAIGFRSSARTATKALTQRQIDGTALDGELKRARLRLLRAQIEPHFLFNTLATIRTLVRLDRLAAVEMLDNLMRYLSEALPTLRQDETLLSEELHLVAAYLRIHQVRMGTRLSYELLVPEDLGAERIPTMLLLTLVENALKHGINPTVAGGSIQISATRERTALVLKVSDTGRGLAVTEGYGMGLANIRRRLSMLYGDGALLSLARTVSHGMVATVSIPMIEVP